MSIAIAAKEYVISFLIYTLFFSTFAYIMSKLYNKNLLNGKIRAAAWEIAFMYIIAAVIFIFLIYYLYLLGGWHPDAFLYYVYFVVSYLIFRYYKFYNKSLLEWTLTLFKNKLQK